VTEPSEKKNPNKDSFSQSNKCNVIFTVHDMTFEMAHSRGAVVCLALKILTAIKVWLVEMQWHKCMLV